MIHGRYSGLHAQSLISVALASVKAKTYSFFKCATNCSQDFFAYFNSQPDPKRLFGYSKFAQTYYATPGQLGSCSLLRLHA